MEMIAVPLSFVVLVWVFGGLVAAALPMVVGLLAILGSMSMLRLITFATDVSIFGLNISTALGLALAIDYTLLIISRYREEIAAGDDRDAALVRTMVTAGRTVLFSAITVALSMAAMILFPMYFLKSLAYAGIATVAFAAAAAVIVTPAMIVLLGDRLDSLDIRRLLRRALNRPEPNPKAGRAAILVPLNKIRHAPRGNHRPDGHRVPDLPGPAVPADTVRQPRRPGAAAQRVHPPGRRPAARGLPSNLNTAVSMVIPDAAGITPAELDRYAADLSRVPDVSLVSAPGGTFVGGNRVGPPSAPTAVAQGSAFLTVRSTTMLFSDASKAQLSRLHAVPTPAGRDVLIGGGAQVNRDNVYAITSRLPLVLALIGVITFVLLFLLTGSLVLPLKALVLNMLSLSAAFGALVWIFQEGHLDAFGTTPTGTLEANMPVLLFCVAFGLSMDYEVFLVSRIREYWLASNQTRADNDESVALGLARTGRVVTAAASIMAIAFAALITAQVSFMRIVGLGLTLAVLVDATLVRMTLLPAFMRVMGRWNWWAPKPLARLHSRIGFSEEPAEPVVVSSGQTVGCRGPAHRRRTR